MSKEPAPARDDENALRLFSIHDWVESENRLSSGAFYVRNSPPSLFLKERLPDGSGDVLHVGKFSSYGRVSVLVELLRELKRESDGVSTRVGLDVVMTGSADPPLDGFGAAHSELRGITNKKVAQVVARLVTQRGTVERTPESAAV